ncbi:MAG: Ldh family oxidoreductase, partial [Alphaproteobacteria bacterium]|nr:Ldh family oxidoreductase [Alphaproteobacteria bacterium]
MALEAEAAGDVVADAAALAESVTAIFTACDSQPEEARAIAENLVAANLAGHDSHGVGMVPLYVRNVGRGAVYANQHVGVLKDDGPVLQLDGNLGYGQVIGAEAMDLAIAKANESGVAIVALRNTHHLGRIGAWGEQCAEAGLVSIHYVNINGHKPLVAPFGGAEGRYATNPYCTALPGTDTQPPVVLDMATSKIAVGKVRV